MVVLRKIWMGCNKRYNKDMFQALKSFMNERTQGEKKYAFVFLALFILAGSGAFIRINFSGSLNSAFSSFFGLPPSTIQSPSCAGPVKLYADIDFKGITAGFGPGKYTLAKLKACRILNDTVSSVRVQSGYRVIFYDNDQFTGDSLIRKVNDTTLVDDKWNDRVSSVIVESLSDPSLSPSPSNTTTGLAKDHGIVTYKGHQDTLTRHGYSLPLVSFYAPPASKYSIENVTQLMKWYVTCRQMYTTLYGSAIGPYFEDHRGIKTASVAVANKTCGAGCGAGMKAEIHQNAWDAMNITKPGDQWIAFYEMGRGARLPFFDHLKALTPDKFTPHYTALRCGRELGIDVFASNNKFPKFTKEVNAFKGDASLTLLNVYINTNAGKAVIRNDVEIIPWDIMAVVLDDLHNRYGAAAMKKFFSELGVWGEEVTVAKTAMCNFERGVKVAMGQTAVDAMVAKWKMPKCVL